MDNLRGIGNKIKNKINLQLESAIDKEWNEAEAFFAANENEVKFRKKATKAGANKGHSFVKINGTIYKLNNQTHDTHEEPDIGSGAFGRAKRGIDRKGNIVVVKVRAQKNEQELKKESETLSAGVKEVLEEQGYLLGQAKRDVQAGESGTVKVTPTPLQRGAIKTNVKVYEAIKYLGPDNLFQAKKKSTPEKNIILAFQGMMAIQSLHRKRLIHKDIKPNNFVVNEAGGRLTVLPVDFDFAEIMPEKTPPTKKHFFSSSSSQAEKPKSPIVGTERFMAPETSNGYFSFASDVYALGIMLDGMLMGKTKREGELHDLVRNMTADEPEDRIPLPEAINAIKSYLEKQPRNEDITKAIAAYEDFMKKGTVYESSPVRQSPVTTPQSIAPQPVTPKALTPQSVHITRPVAPVEKSFFGKFGDKISGLGGKKQPEAEIKVAYEAPRDKDRPHVEEIISYFTELLAKPNTLPDAAKSLVNMTVDSLRACLDNKNNKKVGPPALESMKQLLTGLEVIDRLNRSTFDTFYRSDKKKAEQTAMTTLKSEILKVGQKIEPSFEPPAPPVPSKIKP